MRNSTGEPKLTICDRYGCRDLTGVVCSKSMSTQLLLDQNRVWQVWCSHDQVPNHCYSGPTICRKEVFQGDNPLVTQRLCLFLRKAAAR